MPERFQKSADLVCSSVQDPRLPSRQIKASSTQPTKVYRLMTQLIDPKPRLPGRQQGEGSRRKIGWWVGMYSRAIVVRHPLALHTMWPPVVLPPPDHDGVPPQE